jgi:hypothetical protein
MAGKNTTVRPNPHTSLIAEMQSLTDRLALLKRSDKRKSPKDFLTEIEALGRKLASTVAKLDPILRPDSIFDPADPDTAGRVIALTLVAQDRHPLAKIPKFYGAGVYAIYYKGSFGPYAPLSGTDHPIYVGKADPAAQGAKDAVAQGTKLHGRLAEHSRSVAKAENSLSLADFDCRFLIVQSGFQKSAEDYLINFFKPIWNYEMDVCFGLGKHGDSKETRGNKRSPWDTLHPGRNWAKGTDDDQKPYELIVQQIAAHLNKYPSYKDAQQIFDHFMLEMRQLNTEHFHTADGDHVSLKEIEAAQSKPKGTEIPAKAA